jgi:PPE-repeat protein
MLDFGLLPPEVNSARMYSGAGAAPMLAAGVAWGQLADEMRSAAASYSSVISGLTGGSWQGPASVSMAAAAAPYAAWMNVTAAQAEQTAVQAQAAATAYEAAFAMTVPPPVIAANRAQLAALMATNILGQNAPAIAVAEAHYGEMWAQDAAAMYGYAGLSTTASQLTPFAVPQQTTNATGLAGQAAAVAQATNTAAGTGTSAATNASTASGLSSLLGGLTSATGTTAASGSSGLGGIDPTSPTSIFAPLFNLLSGSDNNALGTFLNSNIFTNTTNAFTTSGLINPTSFIDAVTGFGYLLPAMAAEGMAGNVSGLAAGLGIGPMAGALGSAGLPSLGAVSAGMGQAASLGTLSVPQGWAAAAPALSKMATELPGVSALGATPLMAPGGPVGMPGMPLGGMAGVAEHDINEIPIYGFRPIVMARPPAAG